MNRLRCALLLALCPWMSLASAADFTAVMIKGQPAHPTRILAKIEPGSTFETHATMLAAQRLNIVRDYALVPRLMLLEIDTPAAAVSASALTAAATPETQARILQERIDALRRSGLYEYVEPDYLRSVDATPSDSRFVDGTLWGLRNLGESGGTVGEDIDAPRAWDVTTGSRDVIVAVIDSGIRYTHLDLAANMWRNSGEIPGNGIDDDDNGYVDDIFGINAITGSGNPSDDLGHGTHVAGTIGATANDGNPHVGVAWNVRLMACKFLSAEGGGYDSDAIECMDYAMARGATVLNNSWGGGAYSQALYDAIAEVGARGALFLAAAGNEGINTDYEPNFPSAFDLGNIVSVAAFDRYGRRSGFSNFGLASVDLAAPGGAIFSTLNTSDSAYGVFDGTSMAAPHVSGVAALVRAHFAGISMADLRDRIVNTAVVTSDLNDYSLSGGRLNAYGALTAVPDGQLEISLAPAVGSVLFAGRPATFVAHVTDLLGVGNATVVGRLGTGEELTLRDDGEFPDHEAGDCHYSGSVTVPVRENSGWSLPVTIDAAAPGKTAASVTVSFVVLTPPANDDFANPIVLSGIMARSHVNNTGATCEPGEPTHAGVPGGASVWWTWTAPTTTTATIKTSGSGFDTILAVYTGDSLESLVAVAGNDGDSTYDLNSRVQFAASGGTTYRIAVDGVGAEFGNSHLELDTSVVAPNDHFAAATPISGTSVTATGNLYNATRELGEPGHGGSNEGGSVWWTWTAPTDTLVQFATTIGLLAAYTGNTVDALTPVLARGGPAAYLFAAKAGVTYHVAVASVPNRQPTAEELVLTLSVATAPANDAFANRALITGTAATFVADNSLATRELNEPTDGNGGIGATLWWTWTAPISGRVLLELNPVGGGGKALLSIYTGEELSTLVRVGSLGYTPWNWRYPRVLFEATAGTAYQIAFDTDWNGPGNFEVTLSMLEGPPNDNFADAPLVTGAELSLSGNNVGGTREVGEPVPTAYGSGSSLWWTWVAPFDGTATITTPAGYLAVYVGSEFDSLSRIQTAIRPIISSMRFHARAGTAYHIWHDDVFGRLGDVVVNIALVTAPPNDMFEDRIAVSGTQTVVHGTLVDASVEDGERIDGSSSAPASVWYSWTAPSDGPTQISFLAPGSALSVYLGDSLASLFRVSQTGYTTSEAATFVATAGQTYAIQLAGGTDFSFFLYRGPPPANDAFANRVILTGTDVSVTGTNMGATREAREYLSTPDRANSIWWTWTAENDGWVEVDAQGTDFPHVLGVYTGSLLESLQSVGSDEGSPAHGVSGRVVFQTNAGSTYHIRIAGLGQAFGMATVNLSLRPPAANDHFANRIRLSEASEEIVAYDFGATTEPGELAIPGSSILGSVWWEWRSPDDGTAVLELERLEGTPELGVFQGINLDSLTLLETRRWRTDDGLLRVSFPARAGERYQIAVTVGGQSEYGPLLLSIRLFDPPPNDDFAARAVIPTVPATIVGSNRGATAEPGEPQRSTAAPSSVWWTWTPEIPGDYTIDFHGNTPATVVDLFTGVAIDALSLVDPSPTQTGRQLTFFGRVGVPYHIRFEDYRGENGDVLFSLYPSRARPSNDDFAHAHIVSGLTAEATGNNRGATLESGEPTHSPQAAGTSVWWNWKAPLSGPMIITTDGSGFDTVLAVYTGGDLGSLLLVAANDNRSADERTSRAVFSAVQGTTYHIAVAGNSDQMGDIELQLGPGELPLASAIHTSHDTVSAGDDVVFTAGVSGPGPFTYQWFHDGKAMAGATGQSLAISTVQRFSSGHYRVRVSNEFGASLSPTFELIVEAQSPSAARLLNLSTRAVGFTGEESLIPGFVIAGDAPKRLLLRAVGPQLASFGVAGAMPDPRLTLKRWNGSTFENLATNDDWSLNANAVELAAATDLVGAFALDAGSRDAALLVDLAPGQYTVLADDTAGASGVAMVELYDADPPNAGTTRSRLINLSNRGYVGHGADVMIPGFVISSEGAKTLLLRAVGPGLTEFGVTGVLADPKLTVYRAHPETGASELILANDNWGENGDAAEITATAAQVGAFELAPDNADAAFVVTLLPGVYTVHASGADGGTGVALVEIYVVE